MYTVNGQWKHEGPVWTHWCDGFLPGHDVDLCEPRRAEPGSADINFWREQAIRYTTATGAAQERSRRPRPWVSSSCPRTTAGTA